MQLLHCLFQRASLFQSLNWRKKKELLLRNVEGPQEERRTVALV